MLRGLSPSVMQVQLSFKEELDVKLIKQEQDCSDFDSEVNEWWFHSTNGMQTASGNVKDELKPITATIKKEMEDVLKEDSNTGDHRGVLQPRRPLKETVSDASHSRVTADLNPGSNAAQKRLRKCKCVARAGGLMIAESGISMENQNEIVIEVYVSGCRCSHARVMRPRTGAERSRIPSTENGVPVDYWYPFNCPSGTFKNSRDS